jgi:hypothetical protein
MRPSGHFFFQRAAAATRAMFARAAGERDFARALPPLMPPRRPKLTAAGSLPCSSAVKPRSSISPTEMSTIIFPSWLGSRVGAINHASNMGHCLLPST